MSAEENAEMESVFQMMDEKYGPAYQKITGEAA